MNKATVRKISNFLLNDYYLSEKIDFYEAASKLFIDRPTALSMKERDWEELDDINSDALEAIGVALTSEHQDTLNTAKLYLGRITIHPSELSTSLFYGKVDKFLDEVRDRLSLLDDSSRGYAFERICTLILKVTWPSTKQRGKSGDNGIDILSIKKLTFPLEHKLTIATQCKYYREKVDAPIVRKLLGDLLTLTFESSEYRWPILPILLTANGYTSGAKSLAKRYGVRLLTLKELVESTLKNKPLDFEAIIKAI